MDKEKKLLKSLKFPPEYNTKVDMKKVKLEVIKPWITEQVTDLLGLEDEVLIGYIFGLLEQDQFPDPRKLQINITGFLSKDASEFVARLWKLLISAQNNIGGIPPEFLEKKKEEIRRKKEESERIRAELSKKGLDTFDKGSSSPTGARSPISKDSAPERSNGDDRRDRDSHDNRGRDYDDRKDYSRDRRGRDRRDRHRDHRDYRDRDYHRDRRDRDYGRRDDRRYDDRDRHDRHRRSDDYDRDRRHRSPDSPSYRDKRKYDDERSRRDSPSEREKRSRTSPKSDDEDTIGREQELRQQALNSIRKPEESDE